MFTEHETLQAELAQKNAERTKLIEEYHDRIKPIADRIAELESILTAKKAAYILQQGYTALLNPDTATELYSIEESTDYFKDPTTFMALAEIMGTHPYLDEDFMMRDNTAQTLQYAIVLPREQENIDEDLLAELASTIEPVIQTQHTIAQTKDAQTVALSIRREGRTSKMTYNGTVWSVASPDTESLHTSFPSLLEALTSIK